jgi:hypothetical protein
MPPKSNIDYQEFQSDYLSDMKQEELAVKHSLHRTTIQRIAKRLGLPKRTTGPKRGDRHPCWRGGKKQVGRYMYIYTPDHPNTTKSRYMLEHRLVMEKKIGRFLGPKEVVHHKDGNPLNNVIENLVLYQTNGEHLYDELSDSEKHREAVRRGSAKRRLRIESDACQQP